MLKICCSLILVGRKTENQITLLRVLGCGEQNLVLSTERLHRLLWLINSLWSSTVLHHPNKEAESEEASACWQFQVLDNWKHRCCNPYLPCPGPELFPLYWSPLNGHELVRATVVFVWEISLASGSVWQQVDMLCRMQSHSFPMRDFSLLFLLKLSFAWLIQDALLPSPVFRVYTEVSQEQWADFSVFSERDGGIAQT